MGWHARPKKQQAWRSNAVIAPTFAGGRRAGGLKARPRREEAGKDGRSPALAVAGDDREFCAHLCCGERRMNVNAAVDKKRINRRPGCFVVVLVCTWAGDARARSERNPRSQADGAARRCFRLKASIKPLHMGGVFMVFSWDGCGYFLWAS